MITMYQTIIDKFPDDIRADNALFELAEIYETKLKDPEKAKPLYEKFLWTIVAAHLPQKHVKDSGY